MYVAVTRAIEKLYITSSETRFKYNELKAYVPSRFINEMGLTKEYDNRPVLRGGFIKKPAYVRESSVMTAREKVDLTLFKNGVKVLHNRFGEGMIIEMKCENIAAIAFKGLGIREFNLEIAPIKVIGE
jgi:DNA helicase-2/ATP-dependent DNA helicase PcrA